jgi:hypothetical protein
MCYFKERQEANGIFEESGGKDMGTDEIAELEAEVERLKGEQVQFSGSKQYRQPKPDTKDETSSVEFWTKIHTWQQERAAVVKWLWTGRDGYYAEAIDRGEHWPEGGEG